MSLWSLILMMSVSAACLLGGRVLIHYFQLESYQHPGYFRTIRRNISKAVLPGAVLSLIWIAFSLLTLLILKNNEWLSSLVVSAAMILGGWLTGRAFQARNAKKPLKYTPRIKRLYAVSFLVLLGILMLTGVSSDRSSASPAVFHVRCLFPLLLPLWIALTGLIAWPIEKGISEMYFRDAQRILRERKDLIKIGITGSWGKTSVKFILGTILEEKYHTFVTPSSFNTPMG